MASHEGHRFCGSCGGILRSWVECWRLQGDSTGGSSNLGCDAWTTGHSGFRTLRFGAGRARRPAGFCEQVAEVKTELRPRALLDRIHVIERQAGRKRSVRWGPRTLDIDILW